VFFLDFAIRGDVTNDPDGQLNISFTGVGEAVLNREHATVRVQSS